MIRSNAETINFDRDVRGVLPISWTQGVTGKGAPRWTVRQDASAPSKPNVLEQSGSGTFPWCVLHDSLIENGRRNTLEYVDAPVPPNAWHTLRVDFSGRHIAVVLNGKITIELNDDHIQGAGAVGLWTKADSVTAFDDFSFGAK